jgi:hypothetical protein
MGGVILNGIKNLDLCRVLNEALAMDPAEFRTIT